MLIDAITFRHAMMLSLRCLRLPLLDYYAHAISPLFILLPLPRRDAADMLFAAHGRPRGVYYYA